MKRRGTTLPLILNLLISCRKWAAWGILGGSTVVGGITLLVWSAELGVLLIVLGTISLFIEFRLLIETLIKEAERSTRISVWEQKRAISDAISDMEEFDAARYGDLEVIKAKTALRAGLAN